MSTHRFTMIAIALFAFAAATTANAQQRPAARPLGAVLATSSEPLGALSAVRPLPGGRVLVNDPTRHRVVLLDSTLAVIGVAADSTASTANAYGPRAGGLLAYRGDSSLFIDPASLSMLVIDPNGRIARIMAAPRPDDLPFMIGGPFGNPGFDAQGRLVYRTPNFGPRGGGGPPPQAGVPFTPPQPPDSAPIIRYDLAARKLDTASFIKTPKIRLNVVQGERGMSVTTSTNPFPIVDDWAVLPDGTLAFVRGRDYHVDFIGADGTRTSGDKIAFDWQRLTDTDKERLLDSARTAIETARANGTLGAPAGIGGGGPTVVSVTTGPGGATQTTVGGAPPPGAQLPPVNMVPASDLPDYRPAFASGSSRADTEGRLWIRTIPTKPLAAGPEYDVVDRTGKLVERVAVPKGTTIVGFAPDGIVYLGVRDAAGVHIVRARVR